MDFNKHIIKNVIQFCIQIVFHDLNWFLLKSEVWKTKSLKCVASPLTTHHHYKVSADWLVRNQDNWHEWSDILPTVCRFSEIEQLNSNYLCWSSTDPDNIVLSSNVTCSPPCYTWHIVHFVLNNYHPLRSKCLFSECSKNFREPVPTCCHVCACPGDEVFGRVSNSRGEPIANAEVYFSGCNCVRYLTDPSGNYVVRDICVKGHELFYSAAGFMPSKMLPVPVVQGGKFWKADNKLVSRPHIPSLNVTGPP